MVSACLVLNASCFLTGSADTPITATPGLGEGGAQAGKILGLDGAAGRVGLGIEIKDQFPVFEIGKRYGAAAVPREVEIGGRGAFGQCLRPYAFLSSFSIGLCRRFHAMLGELQMRALTRIGEPAHTTGAIRLDGHYDNSATADQGTSDGAWRLRRRDPSSEPLPAWKRACTCISVRRPSARAVGAGERHDSPDRGLRGHRCGGTGLRAPPRTIVAAPPSVAGNLPGRRRPSASRHACRARACGGAWVRRVGIGDGGHFRRVACWSRRAVVAPVERPDFPRHHHALAHRSDRGKLRQPVPHRGRRHGAGARRARPRRHAHPRHQGARPRRDGDRQRAQGRGRALEREPVQRHAPRRTPQPRRRRARDPGRIRRQGLGVDRLGAAVRSRPRCRSLRSAPSPAGGSGRRPPARRRQAQPAGELRQPSSAGSTAWARSASTAATSPKSASRAATWSSTTCATATSRSSRTSI